VLHFERVFGFRIECDPLDHGIIARNEFDHGVAVAEGLLDQFMRFDAGVCTGKIKSETAILGFHP
jgi:hypothetical protein